MSVSHFSDATRGKESTKNIQREVIGTNSYKKTTPRWNGYRVGVLKLTGEYRTYLI